jgi:hypothetical protein
MPTRALPVPVPIFLHLLSSLSASSPSFLYISLSAQSRLTSTRAQPKTAKGARKERKGTKSAAGRPARALPPPVHTAAAAVSVVVSIVVSVPPPPPAHKGRAATPPRRAAPSTQTAPIKTIRRANAKADIHGANVGETEKRGHAFVPSKKKERERERERGREGEGERKRERGRGREGDKQSSATRRRHQRTTRPRELPVQHLGHGSRGTSSHRGCRGTERFELA